MHVATAMRYGAEVFVTREPNTLDKAAVLSAEQEGFQVVTPEAALASVLGRQREYREQHPDS
jgi:nicotinamidase-related amidase